MLLVFGAPCKLPSLAGQEHGRTIPLAVLSAFDQMPGDRVSIEPVIDPRCNIGRKRQAKFCQR